MKKNILRVLAGVCILGLIASYMLPEMMIKAANVYELGQLMDSYRDQDGTYEFTTASRFYIVADSQPGEKLIQTVQLVSQQFAADKKPSAATLGIVWGPESWAKAGDIIVKLDPSSGIPEEGYALDVTSKAKVIASDADGILYGLNMLHKCIRGYGNNLSGFFATDVPDTKERTVMLDCARKYYTKDWICNFIRQMSWMGYNTIQLHFSEDGGFRADFWDPEYYKGGFNPKNDLSWLCGSHVQSWVHEGYDVDPDAGKYLTTKELVEILETAKEYHIEVVPSFDSPAHMDYITWKFEQNYKANPSYSFVYNGTTYKASDVQGCIYYTRPVNASAPQWQYTTMDLNNEVSKAFVLNIYSDIADFFHEYSGSTKFSIGADEVNLEDYGEYTINWEYKDFPIYINQLNRMLNQKGYTCRMFNDFIGCTSNGTASSPKYGFDENIEIMYWNSSFSSNNGTDSGDLWSAEDFWSTQGRTIYNCIQINCYYVLRVATPKTDYPNMDARNPENHQWEFYGATEKDIYDKWYPANPGEKGQHEQKVPDIDASKLGGGYFLIWNDYASLNTEKDVWEGATGSEGNVYYLLDRMWSNIIKMQNSDINSKVSYSEFADLCDKFGYFPGYDTVEYDKAHCTKGATLPDAQELTQAHTDIKIVCKTEVNGKVYTISTIDQQITDPETTLYLKPRVGYKYESINGADYSALESNDGSGFVHISAQNGNSQEIVVWYKNDPDRGRLDQLLATAPEERGDYTATTWETYSEALSAAQSFAIKEDTMQHHVDAVVKNLEDATSQLTIPLAENTSSQIIEVESVANTATVGKQVGLRITTTPDVKSLTVKDVATDEAEKLTLCTGRIQTLKTGETVKIWLVNIDADIVGTYTYSVTGTTVTETIEGTVTGDDQVTVTIR